MTGPQKNRQQGNWYGVLSALGIRGQRNIDLQVGHRDDAPGTSGVAIRAQKQCAQDERQGQFVSKLSVAFFS